MSVFLGEPSVEVLGPFFSLVVCFLLLSRMSSLHMLDISPLSEMFFANISSHSAGCLFWDVDDFFCRAEAISFDVSPFT